MQYRRLGRTELQVSVLGVGGGYVMLLEPDTGTQLYQRAFDLGLNYFDGRYGDSSRKLRPVLKRGRDRCVVATKTRATSAEDVMHRVEEDLGELGTDYIDVYMLRCYKREMLDEYLAPAARLMACARPASRARSALRACPTTAIRTSWWPGSRRAWWMWCSFR